MSRLTRSWTYAQVASRAEAWIETWILGGHGRAQFGQVASRAEAWIETVRTARIKSPQRIVASRAEAWIETPCGRIPQVAACVASRAEAWIETGESMIHSRGSSEVASRAEAWIETGR